MDCLVTPPGRAHGLRILSAAEMRAADARAIDVLGVPGVALMESAGRHVAVAAAALASPGAPIWLLCGGGNNGGDGAAAARYLLGWGFSPRLLLCAGRDRLRGDAAVMLAAAEAAGVPVVPMASAGALEALGPPPPRAVLVDALLGTGLGGPPRGVVAAAIAWIRAQTAPVVAVDVPSGLCSDTGRALGEAVSATETVTFVASKLGHWLDPGARHVGRLRVVDIGMPPSALPDTPLRQLLDHADLAPAFAPRPADLHKGRAGHLLVVGGSLGRTGAARMVVEAAMRAGAGLTTVALPEDALPVLAPALYEAMCTPAFGAAGVEGLVAAVAARAAAVIGPGMPTDGAAGAVLRSALPRLRRPVVLDADALNHCAGDLEALRALPAAVITPHPGEAGRMLGRPAADVQADRLGAVIALARRTGAVTVLKGSHTLLATPSGALAVCPAGNPGMATAGMGDVLAGIIGALLARGLDTWTAARAGVLWHARAGDRAAAARSEGGMLARDVIDALTDVERTWRRRG